ncbi:Uncharacterised protein [Neisseria gonorrhoeae]|uniref:Uncharacterized protein n=1 Tax=Neisseria gonorrhoeae TaxID=485 RepID=A0A378VTW7_NEIGO|nr:Uncharacterised protein [Neisseria gonorrhoeae]
MCSCGRGGISVVNADIFVLVDCAGGSLPHIFPSNIAVVEEVVHARTEGKVFLTV